MNWNLILKFRWRPACFGYSAWRGQFPVCEDVLAHVRPLLDLHETTVFKPDVIRRHQIAYLSCVADYPAAKAEFGALMRIAPNDKQFF